MARAPPEEAHSPDGPTVVLMGRQPLGEQALSRYEITARYRRRQRERARMPEPGNAHTKGRQFKPYGITHQERVLWAKDRVREAIDRVADNPDDPSLRAALRSRQSELRALEVLR